MRKLTFFSLVGITSIAFAHAGWAAGHGGVFGSSGGFGGGHPAGGGGGGPGGEMGSRGGGVSSGRSVSRGRPAHYYGRGMHYANSRSGRARAPDHGCPSITRPALLGNHSTPRAALTCA